VEGDDERDSELVLQAQGDQRRHEEVGMHQLVAAAGARKVTNVRMEVVHERQQLFLADELRRTGRNVHHAHARLHLDDAGQVGRVAPREDIDRVAEPREMARDVRDVDVLASAVDAARCRQRRRVFADECNVSDQGTTSVAAETAVVVPIAMRARKKSRSSRWTKRLSFCRHRPAVRRGNSYRAMQRLQQVRQPMSAR
jgi:hypothetical protein